MSSNEDTTFISTISKLSIMNIIAAFMLYVGTVVLSEAKTTIRNPSPGALCQVLSPEQQDTCKSLEIIGKLNFEDIRLLRRMAGYDEQNGGKTGRLEYLDLSGALFESSKKSYLSVDAEKARLFLYQKQVSTNAQSNYDYKPSVKNGGRVGDFATERTGSSVPVLLGSSWSYGKNYALLDYNGKDYVSNSTSYEVTNRKGGGVRFQSLRHIKGHHLKKVNKRWVWSSHISKGRFCFDMFYGCSRLKTVVLSGNAECCSRVRIHKDGIKYFAK